MELVDLPPTPSVSGSAPKAPEPPAPPPPQPPPPTPPTPPTPPQPEVVQPPMPPTPTPVPVPTPTPVIPPPPSDIVIPKKTIPHPPTPPAPTPPAMPKPHTPQVNLTKVVRTTQPPSPMPGTPVSRPVPKATGQGAGTGLTPSAVADRLSQALNGSGAVAHVAVASPSGAVGAPGNDGYYNLIREQMYAKWAQPMELAGLHLRAKIQIKVERDGTISQSSLLASSGNATFDETALAAARRVVKLSKPRPNDVPEIVDITFKLAE